MAYKKAESKVRLGGPGGPGGIGGPGGPGHGGNNHAFEKKVLDSLERIERGLKQLTDNVQTIDNKIDLLIQEVEECCKEKPPPRPTGVQIDQVRVRQLM